MTVRDSARFTANHNPGPRTRRVRWSRVLVGLAVLLVTAGMLTMSPHAAAQSVEQHHGSFRYQRVQGREARGACLFSSFPYAAGTLQFDVDRRTNQVSGSLDGGGSAGYADGDWTYAYYYDYDYDWPSGWTSQACLSRPGGAITLLYHGTISASLQGTYNPADGTLRLEGEAQLAWTVRFITCASDPIIYKRNPPCQIDIGGIELDDVMKNRTDLSYTRVAHVVLTGQDNGYGAGGKLELPPVSTVLMELTACCITTDGSWNTDFTPPAPPSPMPQPTRTPAPTPIPTPVRSNGPAGELPTVCSDCPDADWAAQMAAQWAHFARQEGVIYPPSGALGVPATDGQVAGSQEQLRQCLVSGIATDKQKSPAQQRGRNGVYTSCLSTLPVKIPL